MRIVTEPVRNRFDLQLGGGLSVMSLDLTISQKVWVVENNGNHQVPMWCGY